MNTGEFTEREEAIIGMVTVSFEGRLRPTLMDVKKLEGGERTTLRLTVDEFASTDLERALIADPSQDLEALAARAVEDLRSQGATVQSEA